MPPLLQNGLEHLPGSYRIPAPSQQPGTALCQLDLDLHRPVRRWRVQDGECVVVLAYQPQSRGPGDTFGRRTGFRVERPCAHRKPRHVPKAAGVVSVPRCGPKTRGGQFRFSQRQVALAAPRIRVRRGPDRPAHEGIQSLVAFGRPKNRGCVGFRRNRRIWAAPPTRGLGLARRSCDIQLAPLGQVSDQFRRLGKNQGREPSAGVAAQASERRIKQTTKVGIIFVNPECLQPAFADLLHPAAHEQRGRSREPPRGVHDLLDHLGCCLGPCRATGQGTDILDPQPPELKIHDPGAGQGMLGGHDDEQASTGRSSGHCFGYQFLLPARSKHQAERGLPRARFERIHQCDRASLQRAGRLVPRWRWFGGAGRQVSLQRCQPALVNREGRQSLGKKRQPHVAQNPPNQRAAARPRWTRNGHHGGRCGSFRQSFHQGPERLLLLDSADEESR